MNCDFHLLMVIVIYRSHNFHIIYYLLNCDYCIMSPFGSQSVSWDYVMLYLLFFVQCLSCRSYIDVCQYGGNKSNSFVLLSTMHQV